MKSAEGESADAWRCIGEAVTAAETTNERWHEADIYRIAGDIALLLPEPVCGEDGIALFERIRYRRHDASVFMYAFDLIELNGDDLRREPLEVRKAALERVLGRAGSGVRFNEHLEAEGPLVFEHACRMGLERWIPARSPAFAHRFDEFIGEQILNILWKVDADQPPAPREELEP